MTRPGKIPTAQAESNSGSAALGANAVTTRPKRWSKRGGGGERGSDTEGGEFVFKYINMF